jgi:hypothetical protein
MTRNNGGEQHFEEQPEVHLNSTGAGEIDSDVHISGNAPNTSPPMFELDENLVKSEVTPEELEEALKKSRGEEVDEEKEK